MAHAAEVDPEVLGAPLGMSPAQVQGRIMDGLPRRIGRRGRGAIIGEDPVLTAPPDPLDQAPDRPLGEAEFLGDLGNRLSLAVASKEGVPQGDGSRSRHRRSPMKKRIVLDKLQHKRSSAIGQCGCRDFMAKLTVA
jgi:hypothetical protein